MSKISYWIIQYIIFSSSCTVGYIVGRLNSKRPVTFKQSLIVFLISPYFVILGLRQMYIDFMQVK